MNKPMQLESTSFTVSDAVAFVDTYRHIPNCEVVTHNFGWSITVTADYSLEVSKRGFVDTNRFY